MNAEQLKAATGCGDDEAGLFAPHIEAACKRWGIDTAPQRAAFVAQIAHESSLFTKFEEGLFYSTASRLMAVFSMFALPDQPHEIDSDVLDDGKLNAYRYLRNPEKLANTVYANRYGNGGPETGDGWRYRGRGAIQITFKANYLGYEQASGVAVVSNPDLLLEPSFAIDSAGWFWHSIGGNRLLDISFATLTKRINTASLDIGKRANLYSSAMSAFA